MNILVLTTQYKLDSNSQSKGMSNEIVEELHSRNADIDVLCLDWSSKSSKKIIKEDSLFVYNQSAIKLNKLGKFSFIIKWGLSGLKFFPFLIKCFFKRKRYDLLISFSPSVTFGGVLPIAQLLSQTSLFISWDVFPKHNFQIRAGVVPSFFLSLLKAYEKFLIKGFTQIGCMSEKNIEIFHSYYEISRENIYVLPIWTSMISTNSVENKNRSCRYQKNDVLFIFGGQLGNGRGIDTVLDAIKYASMINHRIKLIICGSGSLSTLVKKYENDFPETYEYLGTLSRDSYLSVLTYCNVGIIATANDTGVSAYPSKCLDYMAAGLPLAISMSESSDFGSIATKNGFGFHATSGDVVAIAKIFLKYTDNLKLIDSMGVSAHEFLVKNHSVCSVVDKILEHKNVC